MTSTPERKGHMTYITMKVFDTCRPVGNMPQDVYNVAGILNSELHGNGNDSYFPFEVVKNPDADEQGGHYVTTKELQLLTNWLIEQGAEVGETVLVNLWW